MLTHNEALAFGKSSVTNGVDPTRGQLFSCCAGQPRKPWHSLWSAFLPSSGLSNSSDQSHSVGRADVLTSPTWLTRHAWDRLLIFIRRRGTFHPIARVATPYLPNRFTTITAARVLHPPPKSTVGAGLVSLTAHVQFRKAYEHYSRKSYQSSQLRSSRYDFRASSRRCR